MEKKILTAMLSFAFFFLMAVNVQAQTTLTDNANQYGLTKANAAYVNNLPNFETSENALFLLKTEIVANTSALSGTTEGSSVAINLQSEIDLYNNVYQLIYRSQVSVEEAVLMSYQGMPSATTDAANGTPVSLATAPELQNLVNLLSL